MSHREPASMTDALHELGAILTAERERMGFVWTGSGPNGPAWGRDADGGLHALVRDEGWVAVSEEEWHRRWPDANLPPRLEDAT